MPPPLVLPIAQFEPDQPEQNRTGAAVIRNVFPRTQNSYGPVPSPTAQYNALGGRCIGGCAFRDKLGNVFMFSGTATDLYLLKAGLSSWQNASKSAGVYGGTEQVWNFVFFNGKVIGTNYGDTPQVYTLYPASPTFADLGGSPPRGKYIAVVKNAFVVLGNTYDPVNGEMPQRVWWSGAGDPEGWPAVGTDAAAQVQSGAVDLLGPAGDVQGFAPDLINADAVVFLEHGVRRMMYAGPPDVFTFLPVENARGTPAPSSIVVQGGIAYYWGQDGIYAFDGGTSQPIGANKVDKFLLGEGNKVGDVDMANIKRVVGCADPLNKLIWWAYPNRSNTGGNPNRLLCYNWALDRFSLVHVTCETLLRLLSIGYSLDELETVLGYLTVDTIPAPLSSDVWLGGKLQMGLFDTDHKLNFLTGTRLAATVDTEELQPSPGRVLLFTNSRPLVDGTNTAPTVAIGRRNRIQDAVTFTDAVAINKLGTCGIRCSARYMRGRITIPAGSSAWQNISGLELYVVPQGTR
jgi:hypothetical protein